MSIILENDAPKLCHETGANSKEAVEALEYFKNYNDAKNFLLRKNKIISYDLGKSDSD